MVRMCLTCRFFIVFPRTFWPFISHFSLLFLFLRMPSLFSCHSRVCLSLKFSFSVLCFLVSSLCFFLVFYSSMLDYSFVMADCPSVAFLFARVGCLLEVVEGECLKWVSLFVEEDCPHRFVLSSLFLLVFHSTRVAKSLKMSGEVRFSKLETRLSLSDDRVIPKVTSPSTPYKAWNIPCALLEKDEK